MNVEDRTSEAMAGIFAHAVLKRFDALMGEPVLCSPIVYEAALQVARVIFGPQDDPFASLDEIEYLEGLVPKAGR